MIGLKSMKKHLKIILCIVTVNLLAPVIVLSAEVLQVTSNYVVQIGDNNRSYEVRIACINFDSSKDKEATEWLKLELPRNSKVNFHPKGYIDGTLVAELISIKSSKNIAKSMADIGFGDYKC